jgi:protocatechuate 3,4-dioxygenase beta subunit
VTDAERLTAAMPRIVETVHDLARDLDLTNDELLAGLAFLAEVGRHDEFVLLSDVLGLSRLVDDQTHQAADGTASNVLGPFYRPGAPWIGNPGSVVRGRSDVPTIVVTGRVSDAVTGNALPGAVVDVWQADAAGVYSNEDPALDPWNLRGRQRTDGAGRYVIETVRPLHYTVKHDGPVGRLLEALGRHPWRPAHIHFLVEADGYETLVTQVYLAGGPYLDDDTINGVKADLVFEVADGRIDFDIALSDPTRAR